MESFAEVKIEQRIKFKYLVKLKKSLSECLKLLQEVYGNNISRSQLFEWDKQFFKGCEN